MYSRIILLCTCLITSCVTVVERDTANKVDPINVADARISLGLSYLFRGNWLKAKENLEIALSYAPNYYRSLNSIAYYYQQVGETDLATKNYKNALRQSPNSGDVLNNYGVFLCELGKFEKADELFNRAIKQTDYYRIADSYENAALCSLNSGDTRKAIFYFKRCLDYDPYRLMPLFQLAKLDFETGNIEQARDRLLKIHKRFGYQQESLDLLVKVERRAGNKSLADKYEKHLQADYPDSTLN